MIVIELDVNLNIVYYIYAHIQTPYSFVNRHLNIAAMRYLLCFLMIVLSNHMYAQLSVGSDANSLYLKSGEIFHFDGLTLTPSADYTLTNTVLTKTDANTINPVPIRTYITRYYSFSNTAPSFAGTIRLSYAGASLNGLTAGSLQLNIRPATSAWTPYTGTDVSASSYVEASTASSTTLNTLTLASVTGPLPVAWLRFTAEKKQTTAVLTWSTATEQNTQDFLVQHSISGTTWKTLGTVMASGNSNSVKDYTFTHYTPSPGYNYYRLIQRDLDGRSSYSHISSVVMDKGDVKLKVFPNPVMDGKLNVLLAEASVVRLFDAAGKQVLTLRFAQGLQVLNLAGLQAGTYHLMANGESVAFIIK